MRLYRVESDKEFVEYEPQSFASDHMEATLETWLEGNPDAIIEDGRLLLIGRQVPTNLGKAIDLLAVDRNGDVVVIELKRDETPRTTLAQALEYAAFAADLDYEALTRLYRMYISESGAQLSEDHRTYFELADEETVSFNKDQRIVVVGSAVTPQIRATSSYLRRKGLRATCVEFSYFKTSGGEQLLSTEIVVGLEPLTTEVTSSPARDWMTQGRFLDLVGACRPAFEALLKMAEEQGFSVNWGTRGFSVGMTVGAERVVLFYGLPPGSMHTEHSTIYTEYRMLNQKVEGAAELTAETKTALSSSGLWQPAGNELKVVLNRPLTEAEIAEIQSQMLTLRDEIERRGLVSRDDEGEETAG